MEPERILLSDFDAWHAVLNRQYLSTSEADAEAFERRLERAGAPPPAVWTARIEASWRRVFDLDRAARGWHEDRARLSIQAVCWELRREQVREVRRFVAR